MPVVDQLGAVVRRGIVAARRRAAKIRRSLDSLPSRIVVTVFIAALVASLAVAWISAQTIASFLRSEIDERFPAQLHRVNERLDLWYGQRQRDVETFAGSGTLLTNLARIGQSRQSRVSKKEIRGYLEYVLDRFPQYEGLFLLGRSGETLLWVGQTPLLSDNLAAELSGVAEPQISDFRLLKQASFQIASAPVIGAKGEPIASLHALLGTRALAAVLKNDDFGSGSTISVVDAAGNYIVDGAGTTARGRYPRELPGPTSQTLVVNYETSPGEYAVGSAIHFPRFSWTILVEEPYDAAFAPLVTVIRRVVAIDLGIVGIFSLIAYLFARSIVRPILALSAGARRIADGETHVVVPESRGRGEIGVLIQVFNTMTARLVTQYEQLQRVNEVLEQLSITDELTRLHNHRFFQENLPREMRRAIRSGESLSLVLIDIDDFKKLNDRFGHAVGDAVLRKVSDVMNESVRDTDLLARYGGEEFALLASHTDLEGAVQLAEKVRSAVANARFPVVDLDGPAEIRITVSIGVSQFRGDDKAFFNDADRALYRAKDEGKDCVVASEEV